MDGVVHLRDDNFESEVTKSELPVVVDFWAPWCGPCRALAPIIERLATRFAGRMKVCKLNTDESPETPGRFNIHGIPTLIVFKNGVEVDRIVGLMPEAALVSKLEAHLTS